MGFFFYSGSDVKLVVAGTELVKRQSTRCSKNQVANVTTPQKPLGSRCPVKSDVQLPPSPNSTSTDL